MQIEFINRHGFNRSGGPNVESEERAANERAELERALAGDVAAYLFVTARGSGEAVCVTVPNDRCISRQEYSAAEHTLHEALGMPADFEARIDKSRIALLLASL